MVADHHALLEQRRVGASESEPATLQVAHVVQLATVQHTTLTDCFLYHRFDPLQPSGHYMYHQFNSQQFYVLPTQCIYVFRVDLRTNSNYFPTQH
jgi:hypothetical protein